MQWKRWLSRLEIGDRAKDELDQPWIRIAFWRLGDPCSMMWTSCPLMLRVVMIDSKLLDEFLCAAIAPGLPVLG